MNGEDREIRDAEFRGDIAWARRMRLRRGETLTPMAGDIVEFDANTPAGWACSVHVHHKGKVRVQLIRPGDKHGWGGGGWYARCLEHKRECGVWARQALTVVAIADACT